MSTLLLLLALSGPPKAAEPAINLPAENKLYVPVICQLDNTGPGIQAKFTITPKPVHQRPLWPLISTDKDGKQVVTPRSGVLFTGPPGIYHVAILYVDFDAKQFGELEADTRIVGDAPPGPGPGPGPGPNPPPGPGPASPFPGPGIHLLAIYRAADYATTYSPDQKALLKGADMRTYLDKVCVPDGYRIYEYGVDVSGETAIWQAAAKIPATLTADAPWLVIGNGTTGYIGPCPKAAADIKLIFKSLGAAE